MNQIDGLKVGNFGVHRGGAPRRPGTRDRTGPRRHDPPDRVLDRRARMVICTWKKGGRGGYASRSIANTAQELTWPCRVIGKQMQQAIRGGTPLRRVAPLALVLIGYMRDCARGNLTPVA